MSFLIGFFFYLLGSALVALCLFAIPGRGGEDRAADGPAHGGGHGAH